jgi:hypothetical protein
VRHFVEFQGPSCVAKVDYRPADRLLLDPNRLSLATKLTLEQTGSFPRLEQDQERRDNPPRSALVGQVVGLARIPALA